jgi:hypothetical protein
MLDILQDVLTAYFGPLSCLRLDGSVTDPRKRDDICQQFAASAPGTTLLMTIGVGGVGLNLTAADRVILFEPSWNPAVEAQAVDRAHRIGQKRPVFVYRLVTASTIEERMFVRQIYKQGLTESTVDGRNVTRYTKQEDISELFRPVSNPAFCATANRLAEMHGDTLSIVQGGEIVLTPGELPPTARMVTLPPIQFDPLDPLFQGGPNRPAFEPATAVRQALAAGALAVSLFSALSSLEDSNVKGLVADAAHDSFCSVSEMLRQGDLANGTVPKESVQAPEDRPTFHDELNRLGGGLMDGVTTADVDLSALSDLSDLSDLPADRTLDGDGDAFETAGSVTDATIDLASNTDETDGFITAIESPAGIGLPEMVAPGPSRLSNSRLSFQREDRPSPPPQNSVPSRTERMSYMLDGISSDQLMMVALLDEASPDFSSSQRLIFQLSNPPSSSPAAVLDQQILRTLLRERALAHYRLARQSNGPSSSASLQMTNAEIALLEKMYAAESLQLPDEIIALREQLRR